ncbi:mitogen-activated protein kinase kinase kinase 4 isoform X2 [Phlebotomus argentipes]|uniref:mitogen-activated protein kinase kinase kinase 4 isoform X2 n=1 Tax=Phlebotomus argentipes TaxID=94469 RepID=UPI002892E784|nr:mitogen-activated protein kinase kinase kinase 4 isoform X2 [Phlebotomus argentipes]
MADPDWKKRVGITINYSSGEEDDSVEFRTKAPQGDRGVDVGDFVPISSTDDLLTRYEEYGSTPPRTRIKIKNRDWDRKQRMEGNGKRSAARMSRSRVNRRNTMDCAILNEMFIEDEHKRTDKRTLQLQRETDREIKLSSMASAAVNLMQNRHSRPLSNASIEERTESLPSNVTVHNNNVVTTTGGTQIGGTLIECSNRYMSVQSRPVGCRMSAPPSAFAANLKLDQTDMPKIQNRQEFHETFANLIKLGSVDKQESKLSHEEYKYQTELQDLIWLELQAWHADRTLEQQDKYLYAARQGIGDLLNEIMSYRFQPRFSRTSSVASDTDSGVASDSASSTQEGGGRSPMMSSVSQPCTGCLSMYCRDCQDQQGLAMKQVEVLLTRLEAAEALFPSTQALGQCYPIYKNEEFVGRVKAMCLWYNITRHQRLKLMILGKLMARAQSEPFTWPVAIEERHRNSTASLQDTADSGRDSVDSKCAKISPPKVQFTLDETNESGSSNDSTISGESMMKESTPTPPVGDFGKLVNEVNLFSRNPAHGSPYRKYIETVLKSRGLGKSLNFLHRLHNVVLRKAQITLEKPGSEESDEGELFEIDSPIMEPPLEKEQEDELRRYGIWSPEFEQLALPSYVPSFVFLSLIPMEVIHEFLRLRLETRPVQPNPLSLEQLMKELREGLILAITHRERYNKHITTALCEKEPELEKYIGILDEFDKTVKKVMELYLDYVEQWVLIAAPEGHQRSAMDKEWMFTKLVCPMIPGQHSSAARRFCMIVRNLLRTIGTRLVTRATELDDQIDETAHGEASKWEILAICRATQSLFTEEREKAVKVMAFAKTLIRDIEHSDFHRDHSEEYLRKCKGDDFVCLEVREAITVLKRDALKVREKLTTIIEMVEERCHVKHIADLDEVDKAAVLTRSREILHQGYKFGFEYHRDLVRMMETKIVTCKDSSCEFNLSLGIIGFAKMWMKFVMERCERGRGLRPRWAAQGFDFLILACDPSNSRHLSEKEFEEMKAMMDKCISHVIGITTEPQRKRPSPRSRKTSPAARKVTPGKMNITAGPQKNLMPQMSLREEAVGLSPTSMPDSPDMIRKQTSCDTSTNGISIIVPQITNFTQPLRQIRVRDSVNRLDLELENKLRERNLIGQVKSLNTCDKIHIRSRSVTFRWHRGIKIGQGRFGKVYTAVNNSTGELMAMKEITIQPGENRAIRRVAEELKIFEGITHKHLVKYYGVEIHREELLIFMELCSEGTLESLVELSGGLYESLTRRFTAQLLSAVGELHNHGIVHRDVKTANIFLTNGSNCLKLGDFGSAVKLQTHTTVPGELQGYVGTQAYMAPEVFTKNNTEGHGRAADIWSLGCVVIEMASGKRPWAQFDSNFQIMFKVGMGETPEAPDSLSQEGHDFLMNCLQHDPKSRQSANELMLHNFCKVGLEDDCSCDDKRQQEIRRSKRHKPKS